MLCDITIKIQFSPASGKLQLKRICGSTMGSHSVQFYNLLHFDKDNLNKLIFAHLNINSIRNKFELLSKQIKGNVDVLMISETKIDDSFPVGQFLIEGFCTTYRLDRNSKVEAFCYMLGKTFLQT